MFTEICMTFYDKIQVLPNDYDLFQKCAGLQIFLKIKPCVMYTILIKTSHQRLGYKLTAEDFQLLA